MPPRLLDERALAPLPPPQAELDREPLLLRFDDEPPMSRDPVLARFELELPMSRVPELGRLDEPPMSRVPALAPPELRDPAESRAPTWLPAMSR